MKYNKEFKAEALKLSDEIGVKKAAQHLGLATTHLPTGARTERRTRGSSEMVIEQKKIGSVSERSKKRSQKCEMQMRY